MATRASRSRVYCTIIDPIFNKVKLTKQLKKWLFLC